MTLKFKTQYLDAIRNRYYQSTKSQKSKILDELCEVTGYHRKHAIRILARGHHQGKKASGRTRTYSKGAINHLKRLWHVMNHMCSKKMKAAFPVWLEYYDGEEFNQFIKEELLSMSAATIDRYLTDYKIKFARTRRSGTRRAKKFAQIIPLKPFTLNIDRPGFVEADTVAHCGGSLSGKHAWSLTFTDIYSGWTNNRAMLGKGSDAVLSAIYQIDQRLPYKMISFNSDNGTEFLNQSLYDYLKHMNGVDITRSRAYRKNDNCHVEQKNYTHVREAFGYERYDQEELIQYMNEIYEHYLNPLLNYFVPQLKMIEKSRVGSKYVRKYDSPKTPYQRLMESDHLSMKQKADLERKYKGFNPVVLKREMSRKLSNFKRISRNMESINNIAA